LAAVQTVREIIDLNHPLESGFLGGVYEKEFHYHQYFLVVFSLLLIGCQPNITSTVGKEPRV
jgi:hypothetical protein